jgi:hypothetical protein
MRPQKITFTDVMPDIVRVSLNSAGIQIRVGYAEKIIQGIDIGKIPFPTRSIYFPFAIHSIDQKPYSGNVRVFKKRIIRCIIIQIIGIQAEIVGKPASLVVTTFEVVVVTIVGIIFNDIRGQLIFRFEIDFGRQR